MMRSNKCQWNKYYFIQKQTEFSQYYQYRKRCTRSKVFVEDRALSIALSRLASSQQQKLNAATGSNTPSASLTTDQSVDPYLQILLDNGILGSPNFSTMNKIQIQNDNISSQYIDEVLMSTVELTVPKKGDFRQVVLLTGGYDTRPYRLSWPPGTVLFSLGDAKIHTETQKAFKEHKIQVPRGCLLRRVVLPDLSTWSGDTDAIFAALKSAGYQGDKLSVWAIQGLPESAPEVVSDLLYVATAGAAFESIIIGQSTVQKYQELKEVLSSNGLLSSIISPGQADLESHKPAEDDRQTEAQQEKQSADALSFQEQLHSATEQWLFVSQQRKLSYVEEDLLQMHVDARDVDEDFFDNIS